jgi:glycosyltransferase involved in cell wall biosynthesis
VKFKSLEMKKTKILFEGHDLKFLSQVIDHYKNRHQYHVDVFTYEGHIIKDLREIRRILPEIDIIFCEWGLGNLQWFSHNKLPGQKIVTRIHLQEFFTPYLADTKWENVDKIIVVGPLMKEKFDRLFPGVSEKCVVIPNMIDTESFNLPKEPDSRFNLGLLGILPKRKAPHLGLEILKELRKTDQRYRLFIKGKRPEEVEWLWKKPEEQAYYVDFFSKIQQMGLADAVVFEPHGSDVQQWFRHIGFIISPSEFESFHMAIAEGMASGTIPVIRNWEGSEKLFPTKYSFSDVAGAVALIRKFSQPQAFETESRPLKQFCTERFDLKVILPEYDKIMLPEMDIAKIREEFYQLSELRTKLIADLEVCEKARETAAADLSSLVIQQKSLVDNNSALSAEILQISADLLNAQEVSQSLAVSFNQLQLEYSAMRDALSHNLLDVSRITNELLEQTKQNTNLKEEIIRHQLVNQQIKETFIAENNNIRLSFEKENQLIKEMLDKKSDRITMYAKERMVLLEKIDHLHRNNLDLERRQAETYDSLTWKVGAVLVKKPADTLAAIRKKLFR